MFVYWILSSERIARLNFTSLHHLRESFQAVVTTVMGLNHLFHFFKGALLSDEKILLHIFFQFEAKE